MNIVAYIAGALFAVAALFAVVRIWRGPSILDRMVAADMLLSTLICVLGAEMVYNHHTRTLPVALVLAMFAFVGSVSVARFATKQKNADPQDGPDGTSPIDPSLDELSSVDESSAASGSSVAKTSAAAKTSRAEQSGGEK